MSVDSSDTAYLAVFEWFGNVSTNIYNVVKDYFVDKKIPVEKLMADVWRNGGMVWVAFWGAPAELARVSIIFGSFLFLSTVSDFKLLISIAAVSRLLKEDFSLAEELLLDHAHSALAPKPAAGGRPLAIVVKLHYHTDCVKILCRARELQWNKANYMTISVFPDYTARMAWAALADYCHQLRGIEGGPATDHSWWGYKMVGFS